MPVSMSFAQTANSGLHASPGERCEALDDPAQNGGGAAGGGRHGRSVAGEYFRRSRHPRKYDARTRYCPSNPPVIV